MALDTMIVPENAVYLGTDMGGDFVVLKRQDIRVDGDKVLPAFNLSIYWAASNGKAYGEERIGGLTFSGIGLYVPPESLYETSEYERYDPPSIDFIIKNGWVNSDILYFQLKSHPVNPYGEHTAMIMPIKL